MPATGGTGTLLDRGIATVPITKGKVNTVAIRFRAGRNDDGR